MNIATKERQAMSKYPEHTKLESVAAESQVVGEFLEWLDEQGVLLGKYGEYDWMHPCREPKEKLLARYFSVDLTKLEVEKRAMLGASSLPMETRQKNFHLHGWEEHQAYVIQQPARRAHATKAAAARWEGAKKAKRGDAQSMPGAQETNARSMPPECPEQASPPQKISRRRNMKTALEMVAEERQRQVEKGYTAEHDDLHDEDALAWAACYYAMPHPLRHKCHCCASSYTTPDTIFAASGWPEQFARRDSKTPLRRVIVAAAFLLAEADRRLRAGEQP